MREDILCTECREYDTGVDYCAVGLFEADEKMMVRDEQDIEECLYFKDLKQDLFISFKKIKWI